MADFNQWNPNPWRFLLIAFLVLLALTISVRYVRSHTKASPDSPVILKLGKRDVIRMSDATEGIIITGSIGSGKTTGPGDEISRNLLLQGAGFVVMVAKPDEFARWKRLCEQTGREADLIDFRPGGDFTCDLLQALLSYPEASVGEAASVISMLVEIDGRQGDGKGEESFWKHGSEKTIKHAINCVWRAHGTASMSDIYQFLISSPQSIEETESPKWQADSYCAKCLRACAEKYPDDYDMNLSLEFWTDEWPRLSEKTRSIFYTMLTNTLDKFLAGRVREMVSSGKSNCPPEMVLEGKVVVVNMPYLQYGAPARMVQCLFKTLVQKATLRRNYSPTNKPVVVWQDEAQIFLTDFDVSVQCVARQSLLISVMLTQNLQVMYESLGGGPKAEQAIKGLLGNLQLKIFAQQSDHDSCRWASDLCGSSRHLFGSASVSNKPFDLAADMLGAPQDGNYTFSQQWFPDLSPEFFSGSGKLRRGGKANKFMVDCVVFGGGRTFSNGKPWIIASFKQNSSP